MSANSELGILDGSGNKEGKLTGGGWDELGTAGFKKAPLVRIQCAPLLLVSKLVIINIKKQCNPEAWNTRYSRRLESRRWRYSPLEFAPLPFNSFLFAVWLAAARRGTTREYVRMTSPPVWRGRDGAELGCDLHAPRWLGGFRTESEFSHSSARAPPFSLWCY